MSWESCKTNENTAKGPQIYAILYIFKELECGADSGPWALCLTSLSSIEYLISM